MVSIAPRGPGSQVGAQSPAPAPALVPAVAAAPGLSFAFADGTTWLDTADRSSVLAAHGAEYSQMPPELAWAGDLGGCAGGATSESYRQATMGRVNFYRAMAGVPAIIEEDPMMSAKAQEAALMMSAQGELTHHPDTDYACFTPVGQEAAGNSNLYLGRTGPVAVDGYIEDPGDHNNDVGHRNTILHPPTRAMGVGDVGATEQGYAANALWVFDDFVFDETSDGDRPPMREPERFVAWPPRGHVPFDLIYPRWSFTRAGADFSEAKVTLYDLSAPSGAQRVPARVVSRSGEPGHVPLPTLVWEPDVRVDSNVDTSFYVVISGVKVLDGELRTADNGVAHDDVATVVASKPTGIAYTVTVLGQNPSSDVAPENFLASVTGQG